MPSVRIEDNELYLFFISHFISHFYFLFHLFLILKLRVRG